MQPEPTLPTFGEIVPGAGGRLGGIMRGALVGGVREPDYALIVPDAAASEIASIAWGHRDQDVTGADSLTDGAGNTRAMVAAGNALGKRIAAMSVDGHTDLYLPSRGELWALRANVPELFTTDWYWSSTQDSRHNAFVLDFEYGHSGWGNKDFKFRVRAVRKIQLQHFNP